MKTWQPFLLSALLWPFLLSCNDSTSADDSGNSSTIVSSSGSSEKTSSSSNAMTVVIGSSGWCSTDGNCGTFTDGRDAATYKWTQIGTQIWMAENLKFDTLDGTGSWCYGNKADNCTSYGRLYNGQTISATLEASQQGICPEGWHLPTLAEWETLMNYVDQDDDGEDNGTEGINLKSTSGWIWENVSVSEAEVNQKITADAGTENSNGTDRYSFTALPGGLFDNMNSDFFEAGSRGFWWTSTKEGPVSSNQYLYNIFMGNGSETDTGFHDANDALSIRCIKD